MIYRVATTQDIAQIQIVRNAVNENTLSNPNLVSDNDCETFLNDRGRGWVCEINDKIVGFAIVDLLANNVWALFLLPSFEGKGIGQKLQQLMVDWYFAQTKTKLWLSTGFNTRAAYFYKKSGWEEVGPYGKNEIKFEMSYDQWEMNLP